MRLDGVEIKFTLADEQVARTQDILELGDESRLTLWFYDDLTPGVQPLLPLLRAGVVVRARVKKKGDGDCTIKLRPCRRSQLPDRWLALTSMEGAEYRVEEDWAGDRRVLAASLQADVDAATASGIEEQLGPPPGLLILQPHLG